MAMRYFERLTDIVGKLSADQPLMISERTWLARLLERVACGEDVSADFYEVAARRLPDHSRHEWIALDFLLHPEHATAPKRAVAAVAKRWHMRENTVRLLPRKYSAQWEDIIQAEIAKRGSTAALQSVVDRHRRMLMEK